MLVATRYLRRSSSYHGMPMMPMNCWKSTWRRQIHHLENGSRRPSWWGKGGVASKRTSLEPPKGSEDIQRLYTLPSENPMVGISLVGPDHARSIFPCMLTGLAQGWLEHIGTRFLSGPQLFTTLGVPHHHDRSHDVTQASKSPAGWYLDI